MAPRRPEPPDHRLPPILRMYGKWPISGYSKGSRGLSVLPRVCGIFTTSPISPSPSLRQCTSRYAIHARRNLPDKEFRYLRTLIVRAAVYGCFGRKLLPHSLLTSQRSLDPSVELVPCPSVVLEPPLPRRCIRLGKERLIVRQSPDTLPRVLCTGPPSMLRHATVKVSREADVHLAIRLIDYKVHVVHDSPLGKSECGITYFLNIPAPSRRQSLYVVCSTWQRPVFLINSRRCRFSAPAHRSGTGPLIPKLRGQFA